ncbi:type IV pilin protein [Methylomicrobium lacus]|uniref:type IV pilin protein n=1 Tax=Methylomicrobium lacus TaxID=136992 RepID=UPI0035A8D856
MSTFKRNAGFTLIELMIVVAIVGILAGLAYPSYTEYVKKGRRADAKSALFQVQLAEEKYRANHTSYGTLAQIGVSDTSPNQYYTIAIDGDTLSGTAYTATATRTGLQTDDNCGDFQIDQSGAKSLVAETYASGYDTAKCW